MTKAVVNLLNDPNINTPIFAVIAAAVVIAATLAVFLLARTHTHDSN